MRLRRYRHWHECVEIDLRPIIDNLIQQTSQDRLQWRAADTSLQANYEGHDIWLHRFFRCSIHLYLGSSEILDDQIPAPTYHPRLDLLWAEVQAHLQRQREAHKRWLKETPRREQVLQHQLKREKAMADALRTLSAADA